VFLIIAYLYSSTGLEKSAEQFLHGSKLGGEEKGGGGGMGEKWNFTQPSRKMKSYHLQVNGWKWRTLF
jgi:hypothetical protein